MPDLGVLATSLAAGGLVGFSLGLVGGGGSILAVPLLVFLVGVGSPHVAIGTAAVAVAANALIGLFQHARAGHVRWPCAALFSSLGVAGAVLGARLGQAVEGRVLLALFALLMAAVAALMLARRRAGGAAGVPRLSLSNAPRLAGAGLSVGALSGFFGIGGGFLIVPGLVFSAGFPMAYAIGTSLVAVSAFGIATAATYAASGLVDWGIAALFVAGGAAGSLLGLAAVKRLAVKRGALETVFAVLILSVASYTLWRSATGL
ncbi:MAG: sulfite exporter TauE/SafE family protein [Acetobacteraceae bacterium]|nr:sulfite exporter TauE/SafE family protein [Acetobacteraceae bacterium]